MTAQPGTKRPAPSQYDLTNRQCQQILKALMKHKAAWPFLVPVDPVQLNIPDYFDVIKEPMDLGTVSAKLSKNSYAEPEEFVREVRLVFENAMRYNRPGTDVYSMAEEVLTEFERKVKQHARPPAPQAVPGAAAAPPPEPPVPVAEPADPGAAQNADEDPEEALPQLTMRQCSQLLRPLMRTDEAVMCFNVPVDPDKLNIPDYFSVIVHPMDFGTIDDRLDRNMYADSADFIKDVRLVFSNAKTYNPPGSAVHIMAKKVEDMFERELAKLAAPKPAAHPLSRQQSAPKIPVAAVQAAAPPETPEIVSALCKPILKALRQHTHAKAFNQPVDVRKFPHYTTVISTPMDLRLVAKRLDKGEYATLDACHADVNLIWSNCRTFNGEGTWVTNHANVLKNIADQKFNTARQRLASGGILSPGGSLNVKKKGVVPTTPARPDVVSANEVACVTPEMRHQLTVNAGKLEEPQLRAMMKVVSQCCPAAVVPTSSQSWEIDVDLLDITAFVKVDTWVRRLLAQKIVSI